MTIGGGGDAKRESPDLRSPKVGISKVLTTDVTINYNNANLNFSTRSLLVKTSFILYTYPSCQ